MWNPYTTENIGFLRVFSESLNNYQCHVPGCIPNLRHGSSILAFSDYGGEHKGAEFDSYAFLFTTPESVAAWLPARSMWREATGMARRRMAYKNLSDRIREKSCFSFLRTADLLEGLLVSVMVHKSITSFFSHDLIDRSQPELARFGHIKPHVLEKLFRVMHLLGFFVGGLNAPLQNLMWISDEDAIMANRDRLVELRDLLLGVISIYMRHDLGHIRYGTTSSDPGDLSIEDLAALPDLVTGATADAMTAYEVKGMLPLSADLIQIPREVPLKANQIFHWLSQPNEWLSKMVFTIYPETRGGETIRIIKHRYESKSEA